MCEKALCVACGEREAVATGRCFRCYQYLRIHGFERPRFQKHDRCVNCGAECIHSNGRCPTCASYFFKHKVERPKRLIEHNQEKKQAARWCKVCGNVGELRMMRCDACYAYWRKHHRDRPKHLWRDDLNCKTCGKPLHMVKRAIRGYCFHCYDYKQTYKKERPQRLWGNGPCGFCDCGKPANHLIDKFPLCDGCAKDYKKGAYS